MNFHPPWFDPRMPERSDCVLSEMLKRAVADTPDRVFALFDNGEQWSYADLDQRVRQRAAVLQQLGLGRGQRLLVWLPNGQDMVLSWFAANMLGACFVPINPAYRGALLAHVINNADAQLMVAHDVLLQHLVGLSLAKLKNVIVVDNEADAFSHQLDGVALTDCKMLQADAAALQSAEDLMPWDLQSIIYTSGTTGPSKGVLSSYFHLYTAATLIFGHISCDDRILVSGPMFHLSGTCSLYAALLRGASVVVTDNFNINTFWQSIRSTGATVTSGLLGSMAPALSKASVPEDRDNPLRITHFYPVSNTTIDFARAFDFDYFSGFGMTELPLPLVTELNTQVKGSCGRARSGIEVRLVDEHDCEVAVGEVGELIARSDQPWSLMLGYDAMPEATLKAMRNGWFHTGDLFRKDKDGNFFFVDRLKDVIRRRGENISSQEVENAVYGFAAVADAAAVGVPGELSEDEVLLVVSVKPGAALDILELFEYLRGQLAHFMLPRYIRIAADLPKTPTGKVRKQDLKAQGITDDCWDREAAGVVVKRARL